MITGFLWTDILIVLGVLLFCILMVLYLQLIGCTSSSNGAFNHTSPDFYQEKRQMEFPIKDTRDYIHYYKQPIIIHHGEMLTLYCRRDKQWEKINSSEHGSWYLPKR